MLFRGVVSGSSRRNKGLHVLISLLNRGSGEYGGDWIEDDKAARSGPLPSTVHKISTEGKELAFLPRGARRRGAGARKSRLRHQPHE